MTSSPQDASTHHDKDKDENDDEVEASRAPLVTHLRELRKRLLHSIYALIVFFIFFFIFANEIFNFLVAPFEVASGADRERIVKLIFTSPQEKFLTNIKIALFAAFFIAFPFIEMQIWKFIAPGLYRTEKKAFWPYLVATPVLFLLGAMLVYYLIMPLAMAFFLGFEQTGADIPNIEMLPRVSEYLGLIMLLIFAFGICFQLPVVLTLLTRAGIITADQLISGRKYAIVGIFAFAAILTPPDMISQIGLGIPTLLLYEISIFMAKRWRSGPIIPASSRSARARTAWSTVAR